MTRFQKYFFHPLTALLFAGGAYRFASHYQIFNFSYAAVLCFIVAFLSYTFLSRKYDPTLSIIFFLMAAFVGYHSFRIPSHPTQLKASGQEQSNRLVALAGAVRYYEITTGSLPASLDEVSKALGNAQDISYCRGEACQAQEFLGTSGRSDLKFAIILESTDPKDSTWYVDEDLLVLPKKE